MRVLVLVAAFACQQDTPKHVPPAPPEPPLDVDIPCGKHTCHTNQVCITEQAGHQCWTDADAGIGVYGIHDQYCVDVPAVCHGVPSCGCISVPGMCSVVDSRHITSGCF